jgi:hypothetical protein
MDYYYRSIYYAKTMRFVAYLLAIALFFLIPFYSLKYLNVNTYLEAAIGVFLVYFIIIVLMGTIMSFWIKKEIKNAPNPRKMYWKYILCIFNFTDDYPVIPSFNSDEYPMVPERIKIYDKDNKPIIYFKDNEITFVDATGKYITYSYSEILKFNIISRIRLFKASVFEGYNWFEIIHKEKNSSFNRFNLKSIKMDIDEFEWILEHFRKKI